MTDLWSDPTDDMPRLTGALYPGLTFAQFVRTIVYVALVFGAVLTAYWMGRTDERQTFKPICEGDSVSIRKVPTVWPRGPVAGARP